jgi:hypothetical protein
MPPPYPQGRVWLKHVKGRPVLRFRKMNAESQETPKVASEEPKGTRYLTKPVRLADLPRLAGRKPIDPSKRLFLKLTFVALAAPGSFAVMPGRGFGAYPVCEDPGGELCGLEPDQPGTGLCLPPWVSDDCNPSTPNSIRTCTEPYQNTNRSCTASDRNECVGTNANVCGQTSGTKNTCSEPGANHCRDNYQANVCQLAASNECQPVGTGVSNSCGTVGESINTCNDSGANTCGTGSVPPNSCQPLFGGNASTP